MAPKRSAPPPPPPASSGSSSEETSDEEEVAHSPPPVAPRNTAPPPQKDPEPESSDEEDDDKEGEEEDDDEEGDEEDDEEEEEDKEGEKANQAVPSSAPTKSSSPPPNQEESETSDEEEDEEAEEEVVAQPKPAANKEAEGKSAMPAAAASIEGKKPFQRTWSTDDEVRILEGMVAYRLEHGTLPQAAALAAALAGSLDNSGCSASDLQKRMNSLRSRYTKLAKKGELPTKDQGRRLFDLSKDVWGPVTTKAAANSGARRDVSEMCELYPYLAEEVKALEKVHRGLFKREFEMISDDKARALDAKIRKNRIDMIKQYQRRQDLIKEVTKTIIDLMD